MLMAETGALQALSVVYPSPPPSQGAGSVTQTQAEATALAQLSSSDVPSPTFQSCAEAVIQPNTFWQENGSAQPQANAAGVVVWDCLYTDANGSTDEVWVDTNTGSVDGGQIYALAGGLKKPQPSAGDKASTRPLRPKTSKLTR